MKLEYLPLAITNYTMQVVRNPTAFASKASARLFGRGFKRPLAPEHRQRDFRVPIFDSPTGGGSAAPLHILTNSYPHSTGGYAVRSHQILKAQRDAGMSASAITRICYPVNVGRFPSSTCEDFDGLTYARVLPTLCPMLFANQIKEYARGIRDEAFRRGATVLHTTTPWPNAAATSLAARELGIPWVYEVRGEPEATWEAHQPKGSDPQSTAFYKASRLKEEEAMHAAAAVVALSEVSAVSLRDRGIRRQIEIVPNAVDPQWSSQRIPAEEAQRSLSLPPRQYVGAVSSIVDYEGFDDLILALHHLPRDVSVLLVGDGSHLSVLRDLARAEQLLDRVVFSGYQSHDEIARYYSALDVFVVPRKDTPVTRNITPIKTLQAQAFGIPIVASDLPALCEVTRGVERYVAPGSPRDIASAIVDALHSPVRASPHLFTWADAARIYGELYSGL